MLSHYNNLHCSKYKMQPSKLEIFAICNTRTTYLKWTTRKMQVLFVFHNNIKFVTFCNFSIRCLHENLEENILFCFFLNKLHFQNNRFRRAAFCENLLYQKICNTVGPLPDRRGPGICTGSPPHPSSRHSLLPYPSPIVSSKYCRFRRSCTIYE